MWPRSLFGRLVLVLVAGLAIAQLATLYVNVSERDRLLYRASGLQVAQRIADISRLLDSMPPAERRRIVAAFDAPPLSISLDRPALQPAAGVEEDFRLAMVASVLRRALDDALPVTVMPAPPGSRPPFRPARGDGPPPGMGPGMMRGMGPGMHGPGGAAFTAQVALRDGTRVTFDSFVAPQDESLPRRIVITLAILFGAVVLIALVAVRWVTRPLSTLAGAAEALGKDIDRPPLAESGPAEVRRAAAAFNTMQARLARFINDRTRVFAAMSHDLKTPLTRLRLRSELVEDAALREKFVKDVEEMEAMIAQTLDFMRDATAKEPAQPLDVRALLESLQDDYRDAGQAFELRGEVKAVVSGRPVALRRCLANLLDNAFRYGARPAVEVEEGEGRVLIRVVDEGPGIPEAELENAFEPFFRGESSRSRETGGTGLGLGIARNIARAHGGDVTLRNRPSGGLEATLTLPRGQGVEPTAP